LVWLKFCCIQRIGRVRLEYLAIADCSTESLFQAVERGYYSHFLECQNTVLNCLLFLLKICTLRILHKRLVNLTSLYLRKKIYLKSNCNPVWMGNKQNLKMSKDDTKPFFSLLLASFLVELLLLSSSFSMLCRLIESCGCAGF
jgi:hypothetical protein